ncbi:MAG TPA: TraB/GumN family protein [Albitalea sp.]|uniref:TraB/GumN family protein n=1 Tax=Piscinibacter sp. TaxID=1903157 RepID=UPI002ED5ED50
MKSTDVLRRLASLLLATVLVAASRAVPAQTPCPPAARQPTPQDLQLGLQHARDRGFLWRLRKDGRTSWLYGTVHVARFDWIVPGATLMGALRASDAVALELDLLDPDIVERLRAGMALHPDRALTGTLAQRLKAQVKAACLSEQLVLTTAPEMVATTLMVMAARHQGLDPAYAIDNVVAGLGRGLNKPVTSLETPEIQLKVLQGRTREETQAVVEQALDELESGRAPPMLARIAQVWADGRFGELEHYADWCDCLNTADERAMHRRLLDERNPGLAERIDRMHAGGKQVFAAVGALHMIGPLGLPALLAQRGYQVDRVEFK